jgi:ubiquinone/menaquinone biosynthesis C-methylase UbiE
MNTRTGHSNEVKAAEAFSKQSEIFDQVYSADQIIVYKRQRVRDHVLKLLKSHSHILELNCGTGEDALFFASRGHRVHATDLSGGMLDRFREKIKNGDCADLLSTEQCSFTGLQDLKNKGPFDHIFSNFGGLNCSQDLDEVLPSFSSLLKPEGTVTLVIISRFCLWETLLLFRGKFKTAFRRFLSRNGRKAHVEGTYFTCWYYSPSYVISRLENDFDLLSIEGLCTLVPPSYIEGFATKYPGLFFFLKKSEDKRAGKWPWKFIGDYYIISLKKRQAAGV